MKRPYLSIIIPAYNSKDTLEPLLDSIYVSEFYDFEVIVIDDASEDNTKEVVGDYEKVVFKRLKKNRGAGGARNVGANNARGDILVFIDSDIIIYKNTLRELVKSFEKKGVNVVIGCNDKEPVNSGLFADFKALRDYCYLFYERDPHLPTGGFGGCIAAIRKTVFKKLEGFDSSYRGAGMEDYEYGWRLIESGENVVFNPKLKVKHHFGSFSRNVRNFYLRSYLWTKMYFKFRKFFSSATNPKEALVAGLANLSTKLMFFCLLSIFFFHEELLVLFLFFLIIFVFRLFLGRAFLLFALKEKGILFLIPVIVFSHTLYASVYLGVARAYLERFVNHFNSTRLKKRIKL